ncbi:hypothetical protein [Spirillospora sp. CA-294931]|uniref:hypothetical protein n=1 Tax=Spirillospora sp. CA-294931 TaxID=3240042 RepID=UPI003D93A6FD
MNEQPGDVLGEAARIADRLAGELRRRLGDLGAGVGRDEGGDVWSRATAREPEHTDTAAASAECRHCPICRGMALARESGPDVGEHVRQAGRSLLAAAFDLVAAYERTRPRGGAGRSAGSDPVDFG